MSSQPQRRPRDPRSGRLYRVIGSPRKLSAPPRSLRRAKLDNLALVPGSLLPFKAKWQAIANELPSGDVLIVLPSQTQRQRKTFESVVDLMRAQGHRVTTVDGSEVSRVE